MASLRQAACHPSQSSFRLLRWIAACRMNTAVDLRRSQVGTIDSQGGLLTLLLQPACLYKSEERPGLDFGTVWLQEVRLTFGEASLAGKFPDLPSRILDGFFTAGPGQHPNQIPVLAEYTAPIELRLVFPPATTITISAQSVRVELLDEPLFLELFHPKH